jgi:hypothetical protein
MSTSAALTESAFATADAPASREPDWPLYAVLFASLSIVVGLLWDISWHRTIGRDTFWSPPHVLEQIAAMVAGLSCGWIVLSTTFGSDEAAKARSVRFWGFYGPLGGWICIWGTLMMLTSAPFDDWWHNAYGLDVKIISPPHAVLAFGMIAIQIGAMVTVLARQNRNVAAGGSSGDPPSAAIAHGGKAALLLVASSTMLLLMHNTVLMEEASFPNHMHSSHFYRVTAIGFPLILAMIARTTRLKWPATTAAALYLVVNLIILWALQLTPAQPRLAPIFNAVDHMVPQPFPLLLIVPAFAIDLLSKKLRGRDWLLAGAIGVAYPLIMLAVHWPFSSFLLSPFARDEFVFGAQYWDYTSTLGTWQWEFWNAEPGARAFLRGFAWAVPIAALTSRIGLWLGGNMAKVQR